MSGRAEEGLQRSINEMEFILVAEVSNVSLGTKVFLERGALNCTQKQRGLDCRTRTNCSPFRYAIRGEWFAILVYYGGRVCRQPCQEGKGDINKPK